MSDVKTNTENVEMQPPDEFLAGCNTLLDSLLLPAASNASRPKHGTLSVPHFTSPPEPLNRSCE